MKNELDSRLKKESDRNRREKSCLLQKFPKKNEDPSEAQKSAVHLPGKKETRKLRSSYLKRRTRIRGPNPSAQKGRNSLLGWEERGTNYLEERTESSTDSSQHNNVL